MQKAAHKGPQEDTKLKRREACISAQSRGLMRNRRRSVSTYNGVDDASTRLLTIANSKQ